MNLGPFSSFRICAHAHHRGREPRALGRVVLGGHRQVALLRPASTLVMHVLHYPEQVRACPAVPPTKDSALSEEHRLAGLLIEAASGAVAWESYRDESAAELRTLVEAKLQGQPTPADEPPVVLPLLEALKQSVGTAAKEARSIRLPRRNGASRQRSKKTA